MVARHPAAVGLSKTTRPVGTARGGPPNVFHRPRNKNVLSTQSYRSLRDGTFFVTTRHSYLATFI
jgi:hypothetical protein